MKITLQEWASRHYTPAPTPWVLAQWRRAGRIYPAPERVGRVWYVEEDAERQVAGRPSLVRRLKSA